MKKVAIMIGGKKVGEFDLLPRKIHGPYCGRDMNGVFHCFCVKCKPVKKEGGNHMNMEVGRTAFSVSMDFDTLDEKLQRFIMLRNELAILAEEIGFEVKHYMLRLEEKE